MIKLPICELLVASAIGLVSCQTLPEEEPMAVVSRSILSDKFSGPQQGEIAPKFKAYTPDGRLRNFPPNQSKPSLIITACYTCPVFRANIAGIRAIHRDHSDQVNMFYLYTTEAHPVGVNSPYKDKEWVTRPNRKDGVLLDQPQTLKARLARASKTHRELNLPLSILVDNMENNAWKSYGSAPHAAYLIDAESKVILRQAWTNPAELDKIIRQHLKDLN